LHPVAVGDLGVETAVEQTDEHRYRARLDAAWEIWGPMGGYIASVALRAIGAASPGTVPVSFMCQYLGVAAFDDVDIDVTPTKAGRTVAFHTATISQHGKPMLAAMACSIGDAATTPEHDLVHVDGDAPDVPDAETLPSITELLPEDEPRPFAFWNNFDERPVEFHVDWPPTEPLAPRWIGWNRFVPTSRFGDPWIDACRAVVLVDVQSWPAAHRPHAYRQLPVYAPSLDLYVAVHERPGTTAWSDWLLCDGHSAVAGGGLMGWTGRLWGSDRRLLASGGGQLIQRAAPAQA
jgi:acyl-CoA thioesterase-2